MVKYFLKEDGTELLQEFIHPYSEKNDSQLIVSGVAYAEIMSPFRRAKHNKGLDGEELESVVIAFELLVI